MTNETKWYNRGYLPHLDDSLQRQFITYRLADSLPAAALAELQQTMSDTEFLERYSEYLDAGCGRCVLAERDCAQIVIDNWKHHDGSLYRLRDYVVMPNHCHVDIEPSARLRRIVHAWKSYTSKAIGKLVDVPDGKLWHPGFFDRFHRDRRHSFNIQCYIYLNPVRAGLVDDPFDWEFSSIHRHPPEVKEEIREWYKRWRRRFYASV